MPAKSVSSLKSIYSGGNTLITNATGLLNLWLLNKKADSIHTVSIYHNNFYDKNNKFFAPAKHKIVDVCKKYGGSIVFNGSNMMRKTKDLDDTEYTDKTNILSFGFLAVWKNFAVYYDVNHQCFIIYAINGTSDYKGVASSIQSELYQEMPDPAIQNEPQVGLLIRSGMSYDVEYFSIKPKQIDYDLNYGTGFAKKHDQLISTMTTDNSGIYIFHGTPGTGKTTYIRDVISKMINKKQFIWIQPSEAEVVFSKDFLPLMLQHRNSVFILEDAEKLIIDRKESNSSTFISTLLNFSDGIANDIFQSSFILSYNEADINIDPAIMRDGRMKYKHFFGPLSVDDTNKKLKSLNVDSTSDKPMVLASIYKMADSVSPTKKLLLG